MIQNCMIEPFKDRITTLSYPVLTIIQNSIQLAYNKKSFKEIKSNLHSLVHKFGVEAERFIFLTLLESLDISELRQKSATSTKTQFFIEMLKEYSLSHAFLTYFSQLLVNSVRPEKNYLNILLTTSKIPLSAQVSIALSLFLSDTNQYPEEGEAELLRKLTEVRKSGRGGELGQKIVEQLLFQITRHPGLAMKLEDEYQYLLDVCENTNKIGGAKLYSFLKKDWEIYANDIPSGEKHPVFPLKKVEVLRDIGPSATFQVQVLKNILNDLGPLTEEDIFDCFMMMTEQKGRLDTGTDRFVTDLLYANKKNFKNEDFRKIFHADSGGKRSFGSWNIDNFLTYCVQSIHNLKWQNVFAQFDRPNLSFGYTQHFLNIMKLFEKSRKVGLKWKMPEHIFLKKWINDQSQAAFLCELYKCQEVEILHLNQLPNRRIQKSLKERNNLQKQLWGHLDFLELLIQLSQNRLKQIRQLLETNLKQCPEAIFESLCQIRPGKGIKLLDEIFISQLTVFIQQNVTKKVLFNFWSLNSKKFIDALYKIFEINKEKKEFSLVNMFELAQGIDGKCLEELIMQKQCEISFKLALMAGKRETIDFEAWIKNRIEDFGNKFVKNALSYLDKELIIPLKDKNSIPQDLKDKVLQKSFLTIQLINKIFAVLMIKLKSENNSSFQVLKKIHKQCTQLLPEITEGQISDQIQKQSEKEINRIYREEITITEAIEKMKKLKASQKQQDQEQLASHITFLCSQLTYHYSYPEKQLGITADLFAAIINANLIEKKVYQMFLHVLDEDLKEQTQKYAFAIKVIQKIKDKLVHESWFCEKLLQNELIMKKDPELVEILIKSIEPPIILSVEKEKKIKDAINLKNVFPSIKIPEVRNRSVMESQKKIQAEDFDILTFLDRSKTLNLPQKEAKIGKINTILNSLSITNIEDKARDLDKILDSEKAILLLAYSMVIKRITLSQNCEMFYGLVAKLPKTEQPVLKITYKILQQWFKLHGKSVNDKKISNFKNIGFWLGKLTVGRGYPVPLHKLNLREILINSFNVTNRISYDIPVILKILENLNPEVFKASSPWLNRLFGAIKQIDQKLKDDQKTKQEIQAFFKTTSQKLDTVSIPQTSYLTTKCLMIEELDRFVQIDKQFEENEQLSKVNLKILITRAIDRSIQEIVDPVIDRTVKIAKITTKELVLKDFAREPSVEKFYESSTNMIKKMAGPLAQVTSRQPLKASMKKHIHSFLEKYLTDLNLIQTMLDKIVNDNLDLGCNLIKQAVIQSAQESIKKDDSIQDACEKRKRAKQMGEEFEDEQFSMKIPAAFPEELFPQKGGLSEDEMWIYNEFKKEKSFFPNIVTQERFSKEKIQEMLSNKKSLESIKELLNSQSQIAEEVMEKIHVCLLQALEDEIEYFMGVCEILKDFVNQQVCWDSFKQNCDVKKKHIHKIIVGLVNKNYFPMKALNEIDESFEEQARVVKMFEKWLDTAHEDIEPYLRDLEDFFNKVQNQIRSFFSHSLIYIINKVEGSHLDNTLSFDSNYIEAYSKLIIIFYKTIASNDCSLFLEHILHAIFSVFNKFCSSNSEESHQRPFFKLFTNLISDVNRPEYDIDKDKVMIFYYLLAQEFKKINPLIQGDFVFAWAELISNKYFMPGLLGNYEYWDLYYELLSCLLRFAREYITQQALYSKKYGSIYQYFYKGILKLIIMIMHDFSDFLSSFSLQLGLIAGDRFIQLNNMIMSAYPKEMKFETPAKVIKREKLIDNAEKGGYPKYYKLKFDKHNFDNLLHSNPKDLSYSQKLKSETDENLQMFILYIAYKPEHKFPQNQCYKHLLNMLHKSKEAVMKNKIINMIINLIRYPNMITLFYIDFFLDVIMKENVEAEIRNNILRLILRRMDAEGPQAWGMIYLAQQLKGMKNSLTAMKVPQNILEIL